MVPREVSRIPVDWHSSAFGNWEGGGGVREAPPHQLLTPNRQMERGYRPTRQREAAEVGMEVPIGRSEEKGGPCGPPLAPGASEPGVQATGEEFPAAQAGGTGPNGGGVSTLNGVSPTHPSSPGGG